MRGRDVLALVLVGAGAGWSLCYIATGARAWWPIWVALALVGVGYLLHETGRWHP